MKATLEFDLPQDTDEYDMYNQAPEMQHALWSFSEWLRRKYKHESPKTAGHEEEYEEIKKKFWEIIKDAGIEI